MVQGLIRGMLGPAFAPLLDWMLENQLIVALVLGMILAFYIAGRVQLANIRKRTEAMVLELSEGFIKSKPHITSRGLFKKIYPVWSKQVEGWAKFIPHKHDLWPVPVKPDTVAAKMGFDHQWIVDTLKANHVELDEFRVVNEAGDEKESTV
ncbi:MAG: hypothetical protein RBT34_07250 [Anaerolineaceae bacterium]|jgi:hypothetical protein|nr:hypothetical protein [Anaerolineaceae bacterium]